MASPSASVSTTSAAGAHDTSPATLTETCEWEKFVDESSQTPYYYNARTGESSWNEPEGFVDKRAAAQARPPTWRKFVDDSTGATYYYDKANDVTQWDEPDGFANDASDSDDDDGEGSDSGDEGSASADTSAEGAVNSDTEQASGEHGAASAPQQGETKECVDGGDNDSSNETPSREAASATEAPRAGGESVDEQAPAVTTDTDASTGAALQASDASQQQQQAHWVKHVDRASGQAYYHDVASGKTQWEEPAGFVDAAPMAAAAAEYQAHLSRVRAEQMARVTRQVLDPTGSLARLNAVLSSVNASRNSSSSSSNGGCSGATVAAAAAASDDAASDFIGVSALAVRAHKAEWQQHVDPHTQRFYYHNIVTGATQWHKPDAPVVSGLADWLPPESTDNAEGGAARKTVPGVAYAATATFNRTTGKFEHDAAALATAVSDRAGRHMSHFFDMTALEQNRAEAKVLQEKLKRQRIDWKKVAAEKKAKKRKQKNEWLYQE